MVSAATSGTGTDQDAFVGRGRELGELRDLASASRLVTLCGAGGIGKTRLLQALSAAVAPGYPHGAFVTGLADLAEPDLLLPRVAASLGVAEEPAVELTDTLAEALSGRRLVLALDGYERLAAPCARLCERLLASAPGLLLIAAGRAPLDVPGEVVWPVPPLALPAAGEGDPERAIQADSVRLFASRAAAFSPGFELHGGNCGAVVTACVAAGGIPLAIELAAARAGDQDPAQLAAGLRARLGPADTEAPPPGAAVTAAIGWSHDQLAPGAQVLLRRLSAASSWTLEMVEQVCPDGQLPAARCPGLLRSLARTALVAERYRHGQTRWHIPRAVGDDAAARLAAAGEAGPLGRRLRDYAARRAEYIVSIAHIRVPVTKAVLDALFRDYILDARNVRAALAWCLERGDPAVGLRICTEFGIYWIAARAASEGARWFAAFSEFLDSGNRAVPAVVRGPALAVRGQLAYHHGDLDGAASWAQAGLELCRAAGDAHYAAIALNVLAQAAIAVGQPEDAVRYAGEALETAGPAADSWNRVFALNVRSEALTPLGRLSEARESAAAALDLALKTDHHYGAAIARRRIGQAALAAGDLDAAGDYLLAALPYMRGTMQRLEVARCLADLAQIALRQGDLALARDQLADSLHVGLTAGSRAALAGTLLGFAELATAEGQPGRAVRLAAAATAQCAAVHLPPPPQAQRYRDAAASLGEPEVAQLWDGSLKLTSHEAARLAQDNR